MSRRVLVALWLAFAFATWNVVFDRQVAVAALEFTQEQIARHQRGEPTVRIDVGYSPRVARAAVVASLYAAGVLAAGAAAIRWAGQKSS